MCGRCPSREAQPGPSSPPRGPGRLRGYRHSAIYDPVRDRMLVFGGYDGIYPVPDLNDVWALSLAGSPAWSELTPRELRLPVRYGAHGDLRPGARSHGGVRGTTLLPELYSDVWALSLAGSLGLDALAPALLQLTGHTAIYDPVRDRMVVFGGSNGIFRSSCVGAVAGGQPGLERARLAGLPPSAHGHTCDLRPGARPHGGVRRRGFSASFLSDVLGAVVCGKRGPGASSLPADSFIRGVRDAHGASTIRLRDRMVVFGGSDWQHSYNDVWALSLAVGPVWSAAHPHAGPAVRALRAHGDLRPGARPHGGVRGMTVSGFSRQRRVGAVARGEPGLERSSPPRGALPSARAYAHGDLRPGARPHGGVRWR